MSETTSTITMDTLVLTYIPAAGLGLDPVNIPVGSVEAKTVQAFLNYGVAHLLGNVVASETVSDIRKTISSDSPKDVTKEQISAWRLAHPAETAAFRKSNYDAKVADVRANRLSERVGGARGSSDPVRDEALKLADTMLRAECDKRRLAALAAGDSVTAAKFLLTKADFTKRAVALVDGEKSGPGWRARAEKAIAAAKRAAPDESVTEGLSDLAA